jgi:plastocyanin
MASPCLRFRFVTPLLSLVVLAHVHATGTVEVRCHDPQDKPVADAVAWLKSAGPVLKLVPPVEPVVIEQKDEEFHPYVTPVVAGTAVHFPNRDSVQHHVYSVSKAKRFEIPLYKGEAQNTVIFDQPGVVTLGCNIHDWMVAYVVVLESPYFARSDESGSAVIAGLPPGRYTLELWHPRLAAEVVREVVVRESDASPQVITLTLRPDRRIRRAPDAVGSGYK